jgi:hypothetical protein
MKNSGETQNNRWNWFELFSVEFKTNLKLLRLNTHEFYLWNLLSYDHSVPHYYVKNVKTIITLKLFSWNIFSIHFCLLHLVVMFSDMKVRNICAANAKAKEKANYSGSRLSYSQVIRPEHICWHLEGVIRYFVTRKNIIRNTFNDWSFVVVTFL